MAHTSTQDIITKATEGMRELTERLQELEQENRELKEKLGMGERTQDTASYDVLAVTNVQVWPFKEGPSLGHMKGLVQIVLNDQMVIRGLRIMEGENGLFVSYPFDPFYKGEEFRSVCNPITKQLREHIENCVLEKYQYTIS